MRSRFRRRRDVQEPSRPYGDPRRSEHRIIRIGHTQRPEYSKKLIRMITRVFR